MLSSLERQVGKMFWLPGIKRNDIEEAEIVAAATGTSAWFCAMSSQAMTSTSWLMARLLESEFQSHRLWSNQIDFGQQDDHTTVDGWNPAPVYR